MQPTSEISERYHAPQHPIPTHQPGFPERLRRSARLALRRSEPAPTLPILRKGFTRALLVSQVIALLTWLAALLIASKPQIVIWIDQQWRFTLAWQYLAHPYTLSAFVNPPWTLVLLLPFSFMPLPLATLIQMGLYFGIITAIIFKFGGNLGSVLIALISFIVLDNAIELNIDWIVCIGLIVPSAWSAPFILVKPQEAIGIFASYSRQMLIRAGLVLLAVSLIALLIWGLWPVAMWNAIRQSLSSPAYNIAPLHLLPAPLSIAIGLTLLVIAYKKRDPVRAIWGGLFLVPYVALYSLLLPWALLAVRHPRLALLISVVMWVMYGGFVMMATLKL